MIDLVSFLSSPRRDDVLLREAGVDLDRALFPLLVILAMRGPLSVAALADQVGRDHTTVSRQLSKLQGLELVFRPADAGDRRLRTAGLTAPGSAIVAAISQARQRLLARALAAWSDEAVADLVRLNQRFVATLASR